MSVYKNSKKLCSLVSWLAVIKMNLCGQSNSTAGSGLPCMPLTYIQLPICLMIP